MFQLQTLQYFSKIFQYSIQSNDKKVKHTTTGDQYWQTQYLSSNSAIMLCFKLVFLSTITTQSKQLSMEKNSLEIKYLGC